MAKKKLLKTEIIVVLDRSGSMAAVQSDMEGGLNRFVKDQKKEKGEATFTLAQFDTEYDIVHDGINLQDVPKIELVPRGCTALLDAFGKTLTATAERIGKLTKAKKPEKVLFIVVTDGMENASKEYKKSQITELVKERTEKDSWEFVFLGANQDAIAEGQSYGISADNSANYAQTPKGIHAGFAAMSCNVSYARTGGTMAYSDKQRADQT